MLEISLSGIKKIEEIVRSSPEYVSLSQGSIKIGGIPQEIKDYVRTLLESDATDYYDSCWGIRPLREKLVSTLGARYDVKLDINQVIPTHGCIGGLSLLFTTLLNPGDEVIIPQPAYPAYATLAQAARAHVVPVSLAQEREDGSPAWHLDIERIKAAATDKTKIIIFSNPCNPLGLVIPPATLEELVAWCDAKGIYLVVDEAYRDYVFDGTPYESAIKLLGKSEMLINANSFSKNMAMSGWRVGYLLVSEKISRALVGMQDALLNCLNNPAQYGALYALDHPELTAAMHATVLQSRNIALEMLSPLVQRGVLRMSKPAGGFFLFMKTELDDATDLCMDIVQRAKVGLIPGKSFGDVGAPYLRLCYARDHATLEEGIKRLLKYFM